jgi:RNase P/RNase MRP subunit p30
VDLFQNFSNVAKLLYKYSMHIVVGSNGCYSFDSEEQP